MLHDLGAQFAPGPRAPGRGRKVLLALNTYARANNPEAWHAAVDSAAAADVDALIVADIAMMAYARERHPRLGQQ